MKILLLLLSLQSLSVWSQGNMCDVASGRSQGVVALKRTPNYFFKTSPDGRYVYYIAESKNWVLDLYQGTEAQLPGEADPVPSPDGQLLTYIARNKEGGWVIGAQRMTPAWTPSQAPTNIIGSSHGSYQSVGPKQADGSRILFYGDDTTRTIAVRKMRDSGGQLSLEPERMFGSKDEFRLPMMSPDGTMFSALNTALNKTQIYKLDPQTLRPTLIATLPVAAGKASFSYDSSKITFHLSRSYSRQANEEHLYPAILGDGMSVKNIYTYNLGTKKITQVTDNLEADSYFPVFQANGDVMYFTRELNGTFKIVRSKVVSKSSERTFEAVKECYGEGVEAKLTELGELWARACNKWGENPEDDGGLALTTALNMSSANCRKLANKDKEMLKLCDALDNKKTATTGVVVAPPKPITEDPGKKIFQNRCAICHEGEGQRLANASTLDERIRGTKNRMPPNGPLLTAAERAELKAYVSKFK